MAVLDDMARITAENADGTLRYFARADPETSETEPLFVREDLEWTEERQGEVEGELMEAVAKESYEYMMDVDNVNQLIKVADSKVLFTGFVDDEVAVATFDRGVFPHLPAMVGEFRSYLEANDVEFIALDM